MRKLRWLAFSLFVFSRSEHSIAQITVGASGVWAGSRNPTEVETDFNISTPAIAAGEVTRAVFGWSQGPCLRAAKIKLFRPKPAGSPQPGFTFLTERGPFDVTQTDTRSFPYAPFPFLQNVFLSPPVALESGDVIAITNLTNCGGPTFELVPLHPPPPQYSFSVPGDVVSDVKTPEAVGGGLELSAIGTDTASIFLLDRFQVTLEATNPRTGITTRGFPHSLGPAAGFFSLPELTGDVGFPEVMVKMVDARTSGSLGGTFWFFHAPLTDLAYVLRVIDEATGVERTYSNTTGSPGQLCGGVDASAFSP